MFANAAIGERLNVGRGLHLNSIEHIARIVRSLVGGRPIEATLHMEVTLEQSIARFVRDWYEHETEQLSDGAMAREYIKNAAQYQVDACPSQSRRRQRSAKILGGQMPRVSYKQFVWWLD